MKMEFKKIGISLIIAAALNINTASASSLSSEQPLAANKAGIKVEGSYAPYSFVYKQDDVVITGASPTGFLDAPSKSLDTFHTPWAVGGELNYSLTNHIEEFLELVYSQGATEPFNIQLPPITTHETTGDYKSFGAYLGTRYYFQRWNVSTNPSLYFGFKVGALWRDARNYTIHVLTPADFTASGLTYSQSSVVPSGGIQAGLDFSLGNGLFLDLSAEVVYSGAVKYNQNVLLAPNPLGVTRVLIGQNGSMLSYPISIAIKKTF